MCLFTVWMKYPLIEIRLGDFEVSTISHSLDGEYEGFSSEHSELTHHLPWMGYKQTHCLLLVDHALVDMQTTRQDKVQTHILKKGSDTANKNKGRLNVSIMCHCGSDSVTVFTILTQMYSCYITSTGKSSQQGIGSLCRVPDHPVWLRQLQLLPGAESLSHLTVMGPSSQQRKTIQYRSKMDTFNKTV